MTHPAAEYFDRIAPRYDEVWSHTQIGRSQREAVWRHLGRMVRAGDRVLDLGCGTGEDAARLTQLGAEVVAVDASAEMVRIASSKGVDARHHSIERLAEIEGTYDLVLSNFGALNCIPDLSVLRGPLARLLRPGGTLAVCLMNRVCVWEVFYFGVLGRFRKSLRRWSGVHRPAPGWNVFYPSKQKVCQAVSPDFRLRKDAGIGICVPPSFVKAPPDGLLAFLTRIDSRIEEAPPFRCIGDHRLLVFARV
jgi:ubiquinone/menaquinone biosynthesis C-methylase UbiE